MTRGIALFVILFSASISSIGQNQIICRIIDHESKKPVKEASVLVVDKNIEATSNFQGYFQITADTTDYLMINKPFYETGTVKVPFNKGFQIAIKKREHSGYQGGIEKFYEFLSRNITYPQRARSNGTQGRFYVSFTIDSLGQMSNIKTIKDIGNDCGFEVKEALKKVPNQWIPAETVTTFILPVIFRFGDSNIEVKDVKLPQGVLLSELVIAAYGTERR